MHFAAYNGHLNVLKELLDTYHCDPNVKGKVRLHDRITKVHHDIQYNPGYL